MAEVATVLGVRAIGEFEATVTIDEVAADELTITQHPLEQGAAATDHAFKNPATLTLRAGWSNSDEAAQGDPNFVAEVYDALLTLQASREPITVITGKRAYDNMLIKSLGVTTDEKSETALFVTFGLQQIIIVQTSATTVAPKAAQADPPKTVATTDAGTKQVVPAKQPNKSALKSFVDGVE